MTAKLTEIRIDHDGDPLPPGVYALAREDGAIVGYKVRWREEGDDGVRRNAAKRFSVRKLGSLERARAEATAYRQAAIEFARRGEQLSTVDHRSSGAAQGRLAVRPFEIGGLPPEQTGLAPCLARVRRRSFGGVIRKRARKEQP